MCVGDVCDMCSVCNVCVCCEYVPMSVCVLIHRITQTKRYDESLEDIMRNVRGHVSAACILVLKHIRSYVIVI